MKSVPAILRPVVLAVLLSPVAASARSAVPAACGSLDELRARAVAAPADAADAFAGCAAREGTPLVRPGVAPGRVRALFVFRSASARVFLAGDVNGWSTSADPLEKLPGTDLHLLELDLPDGARIDYKFVVDGKDWTLDPWNPRTMTGGYGPNSELRTPGYVPPVEVDPGPATVAGAWEELKVESRAMGRSRSALVWSPAPARAGAPFPVLYLLDGTDYRDFAKAHVVAGNLIASGRLPPLLLVLVPPVDRRNEYERSAAFERFLVDELVPAVEARWPVRKDAAGRGVMGVSLGALAALSVTARHPGVFGRCGAQSTGGGSGGGFEALLADLARLPAGSVRVHLDAGTFESSLHGFDLLALTRRLRTELSRRQAVQYREVPEGHSWGSWRARLAEAWTFFWGDSRPARPAPGQPSTVSRFELK